MLPKIIVVTINWNGIEDTSELMKSLKKVSYRNLEIIIVDNHSLPKEADKLKLSFKVEAQIVALNENIGFAGGNNIGIQKALKDGADYILLLNNDTLVEPNFLEPLLERIKTTEQIGIVAPQINYYDELRKIWSAGGKIKKIRASGFADSDKIESRLSINEREVEFVSGCCMLIRREVFEKIGLFDENYFLYVEDTDYCYRVKEAGYKIYITPKSKIFHKANSSTKKNNSLLPLYYTTRNRLYFAKKNFKATFYLTLVYLLVVMAIKSIHWTIVGRGKYMKAVIQAFKDFFDNKMGKIQDIKFISYK